MGPYLIIPFRYLNTFFASTKITCLRYAENFLRVFTIKHIFGLVFVRYINEPIIYRYIVASIVFDETSLNSLKFDAIGVAIALQSNILNLFRIPTAYFS